jgi:hypothetical protein
MCRKLTSGGESKAMKLTTICFGRPAAMALGAAVEKDASDP